jgi:hypothetical protein
MKAVIQPLAWGLAMASMLALASGVALDLVVDPAQATIQRDHDGHTAAVPVASGQRWATDAALREVMTRLRHALGAVQLGDPARPLGASQAVQLQAAVEESVSFLIAHCELPEQADAALHELLADLLEGAKALAEPAERDQGAQRILATLHRYPEVFAAPHWREAAVTGH